MSLVEEVIKQSGSVNAPDVRITRAPEQVAASHTYGQDVSISRLNNPANLLESGEEVFAAERIKTGNIGNEQRAELDAMLAEVNPNDNTRYKHPRYYAMTGGRSGGRYFIRTPQGSYKTIIFTQGLFATDEIDVIRHIDADIARPVTGIGRFVQNISLAHYQERQRAAAAYQAMLRDRAGGVVDSGNMDDHNLARRIEMDQMKALVEQQQRELETLRNELAARSEKPEAEANNLVGNPANTAIERTVGNNRPIPAVREQHAQREAEAKSGGVLADLMKAGE